MVEVKDEFNFYEIVLKELKKVDCRRSIVPFPLVFYRLGAIFHLNKRNSMMLLKKLEREGFIEMVPFKGIRFNFDDG